MESSTCPQRLSKSHPHFLFFYLTRFPLRPACGPPDDVPIFHGSPLEPMHEYPPHIKNSAPSGKPGQTSTPYGRQAQARPDLARVFSTAIVSTRTENGTDHCQKLSSLMESPAAKVILEAIQQLARNEGISELEAGQDLVRVFREIDQVWAEYLYQEGLGQVMSSG